MRFSDFLLVSNPTDLDFIVGYTDEQNIRINVLDLFAGQIIGGGTPGYVPVFTAENVIDDSVIFQHGTNIVIGGVDSLGYKLAVSGSLYASNGAVINSTALGADALRVIAVDGDIFVIPNDSGQSISSLRRIAHPPAVLATESATLGQLNTAISNLEGDIEILLDLKVDKSSVGEPNGVASLDATGKIPLSEIPDSIIGQVEYMGTWNAFTNTPTLNPLIPEQKGHYYVVSAAGVFGGVDYQVGDWIISNGVEWQKVDNTDAVTSVFGRIGAILALEADYQSFYPRLSQAYDNPTWINTLAFSKITGVPPFLLENQTITLSGDVTGSGKTSIASTISNNAVTDSKLRDSVGTSVIGRASSTTGDPADIQASADGHVLQRSGGTLLFGLISSDSIGSIDWSKIINTPTTLSGYGITNAYTKTEADNKFVPYTGASANVNLGSNNITANSFVKAGGTSAQFLKADGSVDVSQYVPTTRSVNAGTGLTGGGNLSSDITLAFDTTWGDTRYAYRTREIIAGTGLLGGGDLSANRTLSFDTVWGDARYLAPLAGYVPYTGATTNVNLGEFGIRAGYVQLDTTPTSTSTAQGTIYWDQDDNTIDAVLNGYIMKIGEDQFYPVKNQTGSPIAKGTAVRFAGTVGASGRLLIQPFIADGSVPSTYFMGVTAETIANGADGKVLWFGRIRGINTNAYNEGDILYASTTVPGGFQTTVPVAPNNIVQVAAVITKNVNNGTIFIRPTLGSNINKDEGVKITSPVVGQLLQLQSGNIWENKSLGQVIGGLSSQFLKGDGSLDSTSYVPFARQITINGTTFDLSANRTWNVGTVTSVGLSVPVGFAVTNSPITSSGNIVLGFDSGYSLPTNAKQLEWDTAYANRIASLTTTGTSGAATFISNILNIPQYQAQGNYITNLTGEVTANGPGSVSATISNSAVIGKVLTGLSVTGSAILASDTILQAFGKLQGQVNGLVGGLQYQGTWNANTNTPTLTSGVGTDGHFYIVSVAGNTTIDGLSNWQVGDWIVFHTPSWQKVDNTESVTSVNGQVGAVNLSTTEIPEGTNLYFTNARSRQSISLTTTGSSGAATYSDVTGVFNIPQYSLSGLGGVPTTRSLTINGVTFDLSADRSWTVGDVRTDVVYTNPGFIGTLAWGKITGTPTTLAGYGITDAYTQTQVNNLLSGYVTLATDQTITGLKTIVRSGDVLSFKIGTDTLYGLKVAYNQNELVPSGEATWSFVNTFNRNGVGYEVTPLSFFRGVLVTGERLLTSSINSNLLDYYSNNPSNRYPVYAYNTGVQQFSTSILVGYTNGVVNASTGAISQLPSGVVANFNGRVIGQSAANSNEFVTLSQLGSYLPLSGGTMTGAITTPNGTFGIIVGDDSRLADRNVANTLFLEGVQNNDRGYINFSQTSGNALGAVNGGALTWRGDTVWTSGNITPVTGTGTTNYLPKFTGTSTIGNSLLTDNGTILSYGNNIISLGASNTSEKYLEFGSSNGAFYVGGTSSEHYIFGQGDKPLRLYTNGTLKATLTSGGNLGLGVNPSAWGSTVRALQFENGASIASNQSTQVSFNNNVYAVPGTNDFYIANGFASRYIQFQGQHSWHTAPSGTAGNAISFTQAMTLFATGNLLVGTPSPISDNGARLQVNGTGTFAGVGFGSNGIQTSGANGGNGIYSVAGGSAGSGVYGFTNDLSSFAGTFQHTGAGAGIALRVIGWSTFSQAATFSSSVTAAGLYFTSNDTPQTVQGTITRHSVVGLVSRGVTSAVFDWSVYSAGGTALISNPTGTNNINFNSGNVGIGRTVPYTRLQVAGDISAGYADSIYLDFFDDPNAYKKGFSGVNQSTGSARGLHIFNYDNDSNDGINFWSGTNASRLFLGKFFPDGNFFIGSSPSNNGARLQVSGVGTSNSLTVVGNIRAGGTGTSGGEIIASGSLGNGNFIRLRHDDNNGYITVTRTVFDGHLILQPFGNVGIGTNSPSAMLTLNGTTPFIRIERSGVPTWQIQNNFLSVQNGFSVNNITAGTTPFFIGENGNVGINTTGPTGELHIFGSQPAFRIQSSVSGNMQFGQWDTANNRIQSSGRDFLLTQTDAFNMLFHTNSTEAMRIFSSRNVHIGPTPGSDNGARLQVSGTTTLNGGGRVLQVTSSNDAVPAVIRANGHAISTLSFQGTTSTNDFNTRIGCDVNDLVAFTSNQIRLRIDTNGAATFSSSLQVNGGSRLIGNATVGGDTSEWILSGVANGGAIFQKTHSGAGGPNDRYLRLGNVDNNGTPNYVVSIINSNVGINKTNPSVALDTVGSGVFTGSLFAGTTINWNNGIGGLSYGSGFVTLETNTANAIQLRTNSQIALTLQTNQNARFANLLGIGRDPSHAVDASGSIRGSDRLYWNGLSQLVYILNYDQISNADTTTVADSTATNGFALRKTGGSNTFFFGNYTSFPPGNYTAYFRLKVASNASGSSLGTLDVVGGTCIGFAITLRPNMFQASDTWQYIKLPFTITGSGYIEWRLVGWTGITTTFFDHIMVYQEGGEGNVFTRNEFSVYVNQNTLGMQLNTSGALAVTSNITAGGDVIAFSSSDKRLKDNIATIENPLKKISKIGGYSFTWNDNQEIYSGNDYGVVAQEIEEIFPELVRSRDNGYKAVKYEKLIPLLIESIKELNKEVELLKLK